MLSGRQSVLSLPASHSPVPISGSSHWPSKAQRQLLLPVLKAEQSASSVSAAHSPEPPKRCSSQAPSPAQRQLSSALASPASPTVTSAASAARSVPFLTAQPPWLETYFATAFSKARLSTAR